MTRRLTFKSALPRLAFLVLVAACLAISGCGSTDGGSGGADEGDPHASEESIEVPDVIGDDGATAVSSVEAEGLAVTLTDVKEQSAYGPSRFEPSRDATGCNVTDQDPASGELLADGDEVTVEVDCRQVDWENLEGSDWEAFDAAYIATFDESCETLFERSSDGSMYEDDYEYTATDCQNLNPSDGSEASEVPGEVPDDPEAAGSEVGELDGCRALFDEESVYSLSYGTASVSADDCPVDG